MDNKKDNEKMSEIIKLFDLETSKINPFGDNKVAERAYRRSERISAAIYLLTSHLADTEPLKIRTRSLALNLLDRMLDIKDELRSQQSEKALAYRASNRQLVSLMRLLAIIGHVSYQNTDAVCSALEELQGFLISSQRSTLAERISFTKEDLLDVGSYALRSDGHEYQTRGSSYSRAPESVPKSANPEATVQDIPSARVSGTSDSATMRSKSILEVLKGAGEISIRDVVSHLPEYSEKMIQRELAEMVEKGTIKKTGLKRWSRYSLPG